MTLLAAAAIAGCGDSSADSSADSSGESGISDQAQRDYLAGCTDSGQAQAGCECLFEEITTTQGNNTDEKFAALIEEVNAASDPAVVPEYKAATLACESSLN